MMFQNLLNVKRKEKEWVMYTLQPQQSEMWGQDESVYNPKLCLSQAGRKYIKYIFKETKKEKKILPII